MKNIFFDAEERALAKSFERGEWRSVKNVKREVQKLRSAAKNILKKDARINIRLSSKDLGDIQVIAVREGIPYQTLLSSVIHKYASGLLTEKITVHGPRKHRHSERSEESRLGRDSTRDSSLSSE